MVEDENSSIKIFAKNAREAVGVSITEWQGKSRIDIRIYIPVLGGDGLIPTKSGISLQLEHLTALVRGVRELGDVMGRDKVVARIQKSQKEEIHIGINTFRDNVLIYIMDYYVFK